MGRTYKSPLIEQEPPRRPIQKPSCVGADVSIGVQTSMATQHDHAAAGIARIKPHLRRAPFRRLPVVQHMFCRCCFHAVSVVTVLRYAGKMRVVYTTPRLENAERVAHLLEDEGVQVRLLYGPRFKRNSWRGADYRQAQNPGNWPRVMVLNNGDMPRARTVLRTAGLMPPPAYEQTEGDEGVETPLVFNQAARAKPKTANTPSKIRLALLALVLLIAGIQTVRLLF